MKIFFSALFILLITIKTAFATCSGCTLTFSETWQPLGAQSFTTPGPIGAWYGQTFGGSSSDISTISLTAPPWNPNGIGYYVHEIPTGCTPPNNCTGMYLTFGNPQQVFVLSFWFRYVGSLGSSGATNFFLRLNDNNSLPLGTDFTAPYLDNSGHIATYGATSTNTLTASTWHLLEFCIQLGAGASNGTSYLTVDGTNWVSATGVAAIANHAASNNLTLDAEYTGGATFDFGPMMLGTASSCTSSTTWGLSGVLYAITYFPSSDNSVVWNRSAGSSNYSNVNLYPPGVAFNYDSTPGARDLYGINTGTLSNIVGMAVINNVQTDNTGDRLSVPLYKIGSTVTVGTIQNAVPANGAYAFMWSNIPGTTVPIAIGAQVNP